jgi:ADP-dependent NAD(P)H-hydrate dehydratase / NAD(P)H-hydrate epimerase
MPLPILPSDQSWLLHDEQGSRQVERAMQGALPRHELIERAGWAVARLVLAVAPHAKRIWIAAGGGNNGGDGLIAARHLVQAGKTVKVTLFGEPSRLPADAAHAHAAAVAAGVFVDTSDVLALDADLIVDALLGLGTRSAPRERVAAAIRSINGSQRPVLAVDLPSGLPADTGSVQGHEAIRADNTLSLLTLKPGLFTADGRDHAGRVWFDPLGADRTLLEPTAVALLGGPAAAAPRRHAQHKGSFGDVLVVGGAAGMGGAPLLAARAALASGAGRVMLARLDERLASSDLPWPELMQRGLTDLLQPAQLARSTVVCGCGGGQAVAEMLPMVLQHASRLVLDADALNAIAASPALQSALAARNASGCRTVLTPHPLEAARLLSVGTGEVQQDRLRAAQRIAKSTGAAVVLKGSGTVIAASAGLPAINPTGSARLATAGSGDVLAGWLGGRWAGQKAAPPEVVAAEAVWLHGRAADAAPGIGPLTASALIDAMTQVVG